MMCQSTRGPPTPGMQSDAPWLRPRAAGRHGWPPSLVAAHGCYSSCKRWSTVRFHPPVLTVLLAGGFLLPCHALLILYRRHVHVQSSRRRWSRMALKNGIEAAAEWQAAESAGTRRRQRKAAAVQCMRWRGTRWVLARRCVGRPAAAGGAGPQFGQPRVMARTQPWWGDARRRCRGGALTAGAGAAAGRSAAPPRWAGCSWRIRRPHPTRSARSREPVRQGGGQPPNPPAGLRSSCVWHSGVAAPGLSAALRLKETLPPRSPPPFFFAPACLPSLPEAAHITHLDT